MFCSKCGTQIPDEAAFCRGCGVAVKQSPPPPMLSMPTTTLPQSMPQTPPMPTMPTMPPMPTTHIAAATGTFTYNQSVRTSAWVRVAIVVILAITFAIIAWMINTAQGDYYPPWGDDIFVRTVKNGTLDDYPNKTVGEAFDSYFRNSEWESGISDDKITFVNVTGYITYAGNSVKALVQFVVNLEDETFKYQACEFDGEPQINLVYWGLLENIYGSPNSSTLSSDLQPPAEEAPVQEPPAEEPPPPPPETKVITFYSNSLNFKLWEVLANALIPIFLNF